MRYYCIPTRITIARKRQTIPIIGDDVEKTQPSNTVGIENGAETWKTFWQFIKLLNKNLSYNLEITHLRTYPRENKTCTHKDMYVNVHRSIICNRQKPEIIQLTANNPRTGEWIRKIYYVFIWVSSAILKS